MLPAQKRFGAASAAVAQIDFRLVEKPELAALQGTTQLGAEPRPRARALVDLGSEELVAVAMRLLCPVHGRIRRPQQRFGVRTVARKCGDADARCREHFLAGEVDRHGERVEDLLRNDGGVVRSGEIGEHGREFIAADARDGVSGTHRSRQPLGHLAQQFVARGVAQRIVDELEIIQVDEQHAELLGMPARLHDHVREAVA